MTLESVYRARVLAGQIKADPAQEAVLPALARLAQELNAPPKRSLFSFKKPAPPRGLYLWGGVGRGKSMLMELFCEEVTAPLKRVHFHEFMQSVHHGLAQARKTGAQDAILPVADDLARQIRLLALDEMQITDITDAMIVGRLFERLMAQGITVMTTSNRPPEDLYKNGLNRQLFLPFIALLKEKMAVIELASPQDHRQGRLKGEARYFAGPSAASEMELLWQEAGAPRAGLTLSVNGRSLAFAQAGGGVLRTSFEELCGKPLGAADYLALASEISVLFLDAIPKLSRDNHDRAKRFVTLIDALYEAKTKLYASAAVEPEALYGQGEGSFEFERTASRLREMQDQAWGRGSEAAAYRGKGAV